MLISVDEIKLHLRIDSTADSELDAELESMYDSAVNYCENYTGRSLVDSERPDLNPSLRAGVLLIIGDLYRNREGQGATTYNVNPMVDKLLHFQRVGLGV